MPDNQPVMWGINPACNYRRLIKPAIYRTIPGR